MPLAAASAEVPSEYPLLTGETPVAHEPERRCEVRSARRPAGHAASLERHAVALAQGAADRLVVGHQLRERLHCFIDALLHFVGELLSLLGRLLASSLKIPPPPIHRQFLDPPLEAHTGTSSGLIY